jgi:hypothetical protein
MNRITLILSAVPIALALGGCATTDQLHAQLQYRQFVNPSAFAQEAGIGVLTPSAPTGQEADRQALGDALSETLASDLEGAKIVALPELLSAINQAGMAQEYSTMFSEYEKTGILERDTLERIGNAAGVRYVAKLNLGNFEQSTSGRAKILGVRFLDTRTATIRVHLEIWDTDSGAIVWQGNEELTFAEEGIRERPITFQQVASLASERLVAKVGESGHELLQESSPALASITVADRKTGVCTRETTSDAVLASTVDVSSSFRLGC